MSPEERFLASIEEAVKLYRKHVERGDPVRIVSHSDADGIAAGGILSLTAFRSGVPFKTTCEVRLDDEILKGISEEGFPLVIFSDIGSSYLDMVGRHLSSSDVIILDHHPPIEVEEGGVVHINPVLHGLDGSRGISGAGVAYLFSKGIDEENIALSHLGLVGALADQQDKGEGKSLIGLNRMIEEEARRAGLLETRVDIMLYGYETRPLHRALAYTMNPYIPGLSGMEDRCLAFLKELGIELKREGRWRALRDLSEEEKRGLFSALSQHMIHEQCSVEAIHELIGVIYTFKKEEAWTPMRDGREYASLLNACARMERPSLGIAICLGDRGSAVEEAEATLNEYRRKIAEYLDLVRERASIVEMENIYALRAQGEIDDRIIGVVASILISTGILKKKMPIVAIAKADGGLVKASGRITEEMALEGMNLGRVMMEAAERFNGRGGGHDIAAGAFIQEIYEEEFIKLVNQLVGEQRKAGVPHNPKIPV